jgi:hypothetical protein
VTAAGSRQPHGISTSRMYQVVADGHPEPVEVYPWTADALGVITATRRAAVLSLLGTPHEVFRPDGSRLARFVEGERSDLPPTMYARRGVGRWDRTRQAD